MLKTQADTPAAPLPPPYCYMHAIRLRCGDGVAINVSAGTYGVNGDGSTLIVPARVMLDVDVFGLFIKLPNLTPDQARKLAGYLIDAAAFAEGGDAPDSGALRTAVAALGAAAPQLHNDGRPALCNLCEKSRDALHVLAAVMAPGVDGIKGGAK